MPGNREVVQRRTFAKGFTRNFSVQDALVEVKPLINIGNARISAESVKKVNEITTRLGNDIIKNKSNL